MGMAKNKGNRSGLRVTYLHQQISHTAPDAPGALHANLER